MGVAQRCCVTIAARQRDAIAMQEQGGESGGAERLYNNVSIQVAADLVVVQMISVVT
jgi:hypothetical protein